MELAHVELVAERFFCAITQFLDLQLPDLVRQRLARPGDVAFGFGGGLGLAFGRVVEHVLDHLLAGPVLAVQAGVGHQPDRAPQLVLQVAEIVVRVGVHAQVLAERFGIQAPALGERGLAAEATELRQAGQLLLQRNLEVVTGDGLVQVQILGIPRLAGRQVIGIDVENAGAGAVFARAPVFAARRGLGAECLDSTDLERRLRGQRKLLGDLLVDLRFQRAIVRQQRLLVLEVEARVFLHEFEEVLQRALELYLRHHLADLAMDARDLAQAQRMDLRRAHVGGGAHARVERVPGLAVGQLVDADRVARGRQVFVVDKGAQLLVGRHHPGADHVAVGRGQALLVGRRKIRRHAFERAPEQGVFGLVLDQCVQLRDHLHHQRARLHHAGLDALAHVADRGVEQLRQLVAARQPVVVVLDRLERLRAGARAELHGETGQAAHLVDRHHPVRELLGLERVLRVAHEDLVAEQVLALQPVRAEVFERLQPARGEVVLLLAERGRAEVRQLVVVARIALEGRLQRVELQHLLPVLVVQGVEFLRLGLLGGRGLGGVGGVNGRGGGTGEGQGKGEDKRTQRHGRDPGRWNREHGPPR